MSCMVASATATTFGLSRGLLGLQYDQINASESESESDTNLNRHLTESLETVQKRAHSLCLTNLQCLKERRDSLCKK